MLRFWELFPIVNVEADDDVFVGEIALDVVFCPNVFFHLAAVHTGIAGEVQHDGLVHLAGVSEAFFETFERGDVLALITGEEVVVANWWSNAA
jgi:hypothetical protein